MPSILTHALVGLGIARVATVRPTPALYWGLAAGLAMLPDLDVIAFAFGIPYADPLGHRGFSHSLAFALLAGLAAAFFTRRLLGVRWWLLWGLFFVVTASHGVLDAFTNGGLGVAFFSPFDLTRYFFPWRPILVSPIGAGFFSERGIEVLRTEAVWVWLPLAGVVGAVMLYRALKRTGPRAP